MADGVETTAGAGASRRFALRAATADVHVRVETAVERAGHFDSLERYRDYLTASHALRAGLETALEAGGAERLWALWPSRRLEPLIAADIADLGGRVGKPLAVERIAGAPEMLGVLYVLEGSSLGARLLVKRAEGLGLHAGFGARHLHRQSADPAAWRSFVNLLDNAPLTPADERACFAAAQATFEAFHAAYAAEPVRS